MSGLKGNQKRSDNGKFAPNPAAKPARSLKDITYAEAVESNLKWGGPDIEDFEPTGSLMYTADGDLSDVARAAYRAEASAQFDEDDDFTVDPDAFVAYSEDGAWVAGWVYVQEDEDEDAVNDPESYLDHVVAYVADDDIETRHDAGVLYVDGGAQVGVWLWVGRESIVDKVDGGE